MDTDTHLNSCNLENMLTLNANALTKKLLDMHRTKQLHSMRKQRLMLVSTEAAEAFQTIKDTGCKLRKKKMPSELGNFYVGKNSWGGVGINTYGDTNPASPSGQPLNGLWTLMVFWIKEESDDGPIGIAPELFYSKKNRQPTSGHSSRVSKQPLNDPASETIVRPCDISKKKNTVLRVSKVAFMHFFGVFHDASESYVSYTVLRDNWSKVRPLVEKHYADVDAVKLAFSLDKLKELLDEKVLKRSSRKSRQVVPVPRVCKSLRLSARAANISDKVSDKSAIISETSSKVSTDKSAKSSKVSDKKSALSDKSAKIDKSALSDKSAKIDKSTQLSDKSCNVMKVSDPDISKRTFSQIELLERLIQEQALLVEHLKASIKLKEHQEVADACRRLHASNIEHKSVWSQLSDTLMGKLSSDAVDLQKDSAPKSNGAGPLSLPPLGSGSQVKDMGRMDMLINAIDLFVPANNDVITSATRSKSTMKRKAEEFDAAPQRSKRNRK